MDYTKLSGLLGQNVQMQGPYQPPAGWNPNNALRMGNGMQPPPGGSLGGGYLSGFPQMPKEQQEALKKMIDQLLKSGSTPEEILRSIYGNR